jgi:hypothetical protein
MATDIYTELFNSLQEQINKNNGDLEQRVETIENAIKEIRSEIGADVDRIQFMVELIIKKLFGEDDKNELFKDFETEFGEGVIINASKGGKRHKTRKNKKSRKSKTKKTRRRS